jgi:hypothetical protein
VQRIGTENPTLSLSLSLQSLDIIRYGRSSIHDQKQLRPLSLQSLDIIR